MINNLPGTEVLFP